MNDNALPTKQLLGTILCRIVVPLWVLTGAVFKLLENNPALLPKNTVLALGYNIGIDLDVWLATLIGLELFAVAVMVCVGWLARPMAIFMLGCFCLILLGELMAGADSCGCLGAASPSPLAMLLIDGLLLLGAATLPTGARPGSAKWPLPATLALTVLGFGASFLIVTRGGAAPVVPTPVVANDPTVNPDLQPLPSYWFKGADEIEAWAGLPWREVELFRFMPHWPEGLDEGTWYVAFFRRSCDHCEDMFYKDLAPHPDFARRVVAIQVPEEKDRLDLPGGFTIPDTEAALMQLPMGTNWIMTTPLALRIENGIVQCALEGDHHECFGLESDHDHDH